MKNFKNIIAQLNSQGKMFFIEPVSEKDIVSFEENNSFKLPQKYKEWLCYSDGGELFLPAGVQLYGIKHNPKIDVEDNNRPNNNYIVIGALASGDTICCIDNEEKIVIYNLESGTIEEDEIYDNFSDFLNDLSNLLGME